MENFDKWKQGNLANEEFFMEVHRDCSKVYGSPLFRLNKECPMNPRMLRNLQLMNNMNNWQVLFDRHTDPFQGADHHGYVATQLSHLSHRRPENIDI